MIETRKDIMEKRSSPDASRPRKVNLRYLRLRARGWKNDLKASVGRILRPAATAHPL